MVVVVRFTEWGNALSWCKSSQRQKDSNVCANLLFFPALLRPCCVKSRMENSFCSRFMSTRVWLHYTSDILYFSTHLRPSVCASVRGMCVSVHTWWERDNEGGKGRERERERNERGSRALEQGKHSGLMCECTPCLWQVFFAISRDSVKFEPEVPAAAVALYFSNRHLLS